MENNIYKQIYQDTNENGITLLEEFNTPSDILYSLLEKEDYYIAIESLYPEATELDKLKIGIKWAMEALNETQNKLEKAGNL